MHDIDSKAHGTVAVENRLFTLPEAARYLGCTLWSVRDLIWKGALPYTRFGKRFQVDVRDLDALIEREKRREGRDSVASYFDSNLDAVVVTLPAEGGQGDGLSCGDQTTRAKQKSPRRRLCL
jgi:excisionase family DNA binding protein